jgi:hypothetical protein
MRRGDLPRWLLVLFKCGHWAVTRPIWDLGSPFLGRRPVIDLRTGYVAPFPPTDVETAKKLCVALERFDMQSKRDPRDETKAAEACRAAFDAVCRASEVQG